MSDTAHTEPANAALLAAQAGAAKKAKDIRILDVGDLLGIVDFFVLLSAGSERQLNTVVEEVEHRFSKDASRRPLRREGTAESGWRILDFGDVVVHVFAEEQREFYGLERLWADAPEVVLPESEFAAANL